MKLLDVSLDVSIDMKPIAMGLILAVAPGLGQLSS
jgi:hypothetical protein